MATLVTEIRRFFARAEPGPENRFPDLVVCSVPSFQASWRRTLRLLCLHRAKLYAGRPWGLLWGTQSLAIAAREGGAHGVNVRLQGLLVGPDAKIDMWLARRQGKYVKWLLDEAIRDGRRSEGEETELATDVVRLMCDMIESIRWEHLPEKVDQQRAARPHADHAE